MNQKKRLAEFSEYKKRALKNPGLRRALAEPDEDPFLETAYRLITLRDEKGWTQAELARKLGISQQAVARLESPNYKGHSLNSLHKIAKVYGKKLQIAFVPANGSTQGDGVKLDRLVQRQVHARQYSEYSNPRRAKKHFR